MKVLLIKYDLLSIWLLSKVGNLGMVEVPQELDVTKGWGVLDKQEIGVNMSRVGKILIANPTMPDENPFSKSVIYIYADDSVQGTTGVILNKPSENTVKQLCFNNFQTGWKSKNTKINTSPN